MFVHHRTNPKTPRVHPDLCQRYIAAMTSTLHKCVHCHTISIVYLCPRKTDPRTIYEYDCHVCEGFNRFVPVKCIEQVGELPDRAMCAQPARAYECDVETIRLISANQLQLAR